MNKIALYLLNLRIYENFGWDTAYRNAMNIFKEITEDDIEEYKSVMKIESLNLI